MKFYLTIICSMLFSALVAQNVYIAHRGASYDAPENTVAAARLAWETGADAVEIDVYLASDNRVVVIHDKDTQRTCGGKNFVIKTTPSVVLRDLDAGIWKGEQFKGERIPYIEEVIATVPEGKMLVVEIKCGSEVIPHLERIIGKSEKKGQIVFICFGWETIVNVKKAFPDNKAYWLSGSKQAAIKKLDKLQRWESKGSTCNTRPSMRNWSPWQGENLEVLAWTVDNPEEAKRLNALGVTWITTNRPSWLKEQLER